MRHDRFQYLLEQVRDERGKRRWTVARIAERIGSNRSHVNEVLNNKPGHGYRTRRKLVGFFKANFENWNELLAALGWKEDGGFVPRGTLQMEHSDSNSESDSCALASPKGND